MKKKIEEKKMERYTFRNKRKRYRCELQDMVCSISASRSG